LDIWEKLPEHFGDALRDEFGFEPPRKRGLDVVDSIRALRDGDARLFVGLGGNFAAAAPDPDITHEALRSAALTVQISTKLNRSHVVCGETALILPTLGRSERDVQASGEQFVSVEDSMSSVHRSHARLEPASPHLRSEVAIICGLASAATGVQPAGTSIDWTALTADYEHIRGHIAHVVPGCEAYGEKISRPGGFVLPHPPRDSRTFETESKRAVFTVSLMGVLAVPDGYLLLQSIRSHDQFNTTIYGHDDRYRGIEGGRDVVLVHPDDIAQSGFQADQLVDVVSTWEDRSERVLNGCRLVPYATPRGCAAAYYPEANALVPLDSTARGSNCPTPKSVVVRLMTVDPGRRSKVGKDGKIAFAIGAGSVDLVGDVVGYYQESFPPQSSLTAVSPTRVLDTRPGSGHLGFPTLGSGQVSSLVIPGAPAGATSAVLNVTVTNPTASGFATVFPTAGPPNSPPGASNLNFVAHQTVANLVIAKLGVGGSVSFFNSFGSTDLVVDVVGWYTTAGTLAFTSVNPVRLLDSREPGAPITRMAPGNHRDLLVANGVTVPADAKAVLVNVTAVNPGAPGYLTVYPTGPAPNPPPLASNLNFTKGAIVPNLVVATLSANGKLSIYNGSTGGSVDVIVDLVGWYR